MMNIINMIVNPTDEAKKWGKMPIKVRDYNPCTPDMICCPDNGGKIVGNRIDNI
ncbi:hypothetical protein ER45_028445 (plasmid) [Bacillus mycoides]|nr:hypothetical protein ER45_028445 [Bacillus mycoides]